MDGFNQVTRLTVASFERELLREAAVAFDKSLVMLRFGAECVKVGLPRKLGKDVIGAFNASILGGRVGWLTGCAPSKPRQRSHCFLRPSGHATLGRLFVASLPVLGIRCSQLCRRFPFHHEFGRRNLPEACVACRGGG